MSTRERVNSSGYWNQRFTEDWDAMGGPRQSRFFTGIALELMPPWLTQTILRNSFSVADWGCAQGDGTNVLAQRVRPGYLTGIDFSRTSIEQARTRYPNLTFRCEDWLCADTAIGERFDVVLSSNTLEHFHDPVRVLDVIAARARRAVVLLLPYRELDRIEEHFASFFAETIDQRLSNGFTLHWSRVTDCRPMQETMWSGEQILLVYADPAWTASLGLRLGDVLVDREPGGAEGERNKVDAFQNGVSAMHEELARLTDVLGAALATRDAWIGALRNDLASRDAELAALHMGSWKQLESIERLERLVSQKKEERAESLQAAVAHRARADEFERRIHDLWGSRSWRVTRPLRAAAIAARAITDQNSRDRLAKAISGILPKQLRQRLDTRRDIDRYVDVGADATRSAAAVANAGPLVRPEWLLAVDDAARVVVVTCGFEFDELVNQRPINAAKHYSRSGYLVLFVAWQWSPAEEMKNGCAEVWPGVYQVPKYQFLGEVDRFTNKGDDSLFLLTLPAPVLVDAVQALRGRGYSIVYDIMDEWEEFNRAGQAPWYDAETESKLVMQADCVVAVTPSLVAKFAGLRTDIEVVGNGYSPDILGEDTRGIAGTQATSGQPLVGYFGHLTDAWFDWTSVFRIAARFPGIRFEIIGYGEPEWVSRKAQDHENVVLLGKVHPSSLHSYVRHWTHGIIPFVEGPLARAVDPIKIYEYLWFGLPTFVCGIEHLRTLPSVTYAAADEAVAVFEGFLGSAPPKRAALEAFLENATWAARFDRLSDRVMHCKGLAVLYAD